MEIYKGTGVLKTGDKKVTKSIGALLIAMSKNVSALTNETITIWIERVNRGNVFLATSVKLQDFIALTSYGTENVQSSNDYKSIALCELTPDGAGLHLNEGESLQFKLEGLIAGDTYAIYGIEEPTTTMDFYLFDRKTVASEDVQRRLTVEGNELVIFNTQSVNEFMIGYGNGVSIKYSPFELQTITRDVDPIFSIVDDGTVTQGLPNRIIMPVFGIEFVEFQKEAGTLIVLTSRTNTNLLDIQ